MKSLPRRVGVAGSPSLSPIRPSRENPLIVPGEDIRVFCNDGQQCYPPYEPLPPDRERRLLVHRWPLEPDITGIICSLMGEPGQVVIDWLLHKAGTRRQAGWTYELVNVRDVGDFEWRSRRRPDIAIWRWRGDGRKAQTVLLVEYKTGAQTNDGDANRFCPSGRHHSLAWSGQPICYPTCLASRPMLDVQYLWLCPRKDVADPFRSARGHVSRCYGEAEVRSVLEALNQAEHVWHVAAIEDLFHRLVETGHLAAAAVPGVRLGLVAITDSDEAA